MMLFLIEYNLTLLCRSFSGERTGYAFGPNRSVKSKPRTHSR